MLAMGIWHSPLSHMAHAHTLICSPKCHVSALTSDYCNPNPLHISQSDSSASVASSDRRALSSSLGSPAAPTTVLGGAPANRGPYLPGGRGFFGLPCFGFGAIGNSAYRQMATHRH